MIAIKNANSSSSKTAIEDGKGSAVENCLKSTSWMKILILVHQPDLLMLQIRLCAAKKNLGKNEPTFDCKPTFAKPASGLKAPNF